MHRVVNGETIPLTEKEISERESDEFQNLMEEEACRKKMQRLAAFGNPLDHIERISKALSHLKINGIDVGEDGEAQCALIETINQEEEEGNNETF